MADERHSDLTVALAFLAGAMAGAGIALLLAPRSGAETRARVGEWIHELQDKLAEVTGPGGGDEGDLEEEHGGSRAASG